jgi:predicted HTH transcriptional regulator
MNKKPLDVYITEDWRFVTQPKLEGQWFERKAHPTTRTPSNLKEFKEKIARTICGFANSNSDTGGLFVVGLGNRGELYGVDHHGTDYLNTILSYGELLDGPTAEHKLIEFTRENGTTDHLVFIYTRFLPQRVARTTDGECYIRRADQTIKQRPDHAQALAYNKGELQFEDERALLLNEDDLESGVVKEFIEQYVQKRRLSETPHIKGLLRLARLVTLKDGQIWLTKGGLLVFHKDPRAAIPGAYVRYLRYEGRDKQSSTLIRDEQFEGPLPIVIQKLREFLPTQFSRFSYRSASGALTSEDEYPATAWDEAIVNALVHRSYSQQTRPVRIEHFDDRVAVTSPGSYPLGVTPDNLIHTPRNTNTMEALRYLDFVRMAEEGTKAMRQAMLTAGLPKPHYSPPDLDHVTCTLFNNIDERLRSRTDPAAHARTSPTTIVSNLYPLIIQPSFMPDPHDPLLDDSGKPIFQEIRKALIQALRSAGFRVDSFTQSTAIDVTEEYVVPALKRSRVAAIYPGIEFRLREFGYGLYLILDHTVQVRNRLNAAEVQRSLPWLSLSNRRRSFARVNNRWMPGFILDADKESWHVELLGGDRDNRTVVSIDPKSIIPDLKTIELAALLQSRNVPIQLFHEVRKASLVAVQEAPRQRLDRLQTIVETLSQRIFPLAVGSSEVQLTPTPARLNRSPFYLGHRLRDPKPQFDNKGLRQEDDIVRGLTTFGSFQKPATEVPLFVVCPAAWSSKMHAFVRRLRQGHQRYRGMEATFGVRLGGVTTVIAEIAEYEAKVTEAIAQIPNGSLPIFIVLAPERDISRADYNAPYYRIKRLLLEAGYPSQMVDEDTLDDPNWKDLNFALDLFAKAGYVPWVLSEGMPRADLFIGLSSSVISHQGQRRRLVGYANVFDEYGRWLFYEGASESVPYEERNAMFADLLTKIVRNYRAKRRKPGWVHIHHSAKLSQIDRAEIARGILREAEEAEISFVYINEHSSFRLFDESGRGDGAAERGTWLKLSPNSLLIATTGPNPIGQKYHGTPRPLEVRVNRVQERGPLDLADYVQQILSLTRLNWASSRSFCHTPITIKFANDIAYLMNVFLATGSSFTLHERLRSTPWFL